MENILTNKITVLKTNIKKLFFAILIIPSLCLCQGVFDDFEEMDGVTSVVVNNKMFKMLASIDAETDDPDFQNFIEMAEKINSLKIFTTDNASITKMMKTRVSNYINDAKIEELMRIKDGDSNVKIYVKEGKDENHVKELLMFVNGFGDKIPEMKNHNIKTETIVLSLVGDIDLRQIAKLTDKMNVPGGKHLKKANKK